jgi:hypothetical protein
LIQKNDFNYKKFIQKKYFVKTQVDFTFDLILKSKSSRKLSILKETIRWYLPSPHFVLSKKKKSDNYKNELKFIENGFSLYNDYHNFFLNSLKCKKLSLFL